MLRTTLALALVLVGGCQDDTSSSGPPQNLVGSNSDCTVVLREVQNLSGSDAYASECQLLAGDDFCGWAFRGWLDVADAAAGTGTAGVRYHADWDGPVDDKESWHEVFVRPNPVSQAGGYTRYEFAFHYPTSTSIGGVSIQLIPFVETPQGRIWDHNVNKGTLDNYVLSDDNARSIRVDENEVCRLADDFGGPSRLSCNSTNLGLTDATIDLQKDWRTRYLVRVGMTQPETQLIETIAILGWTGNAWNFQEPDTSAPFHLLAFPSGQGGNVQVYDSHDRLIMDTEEIECRFFEHQAGESPRP